MVLCAIRPANWRPATGADFHRLAEQGRERAIEIWEVREATEDGGAETVGYVATSARDYGVCYRVDVVTGCTCQGYARQLRCSHHALLLAKLNMLPDPDEPGPAGPAAGGDPGHLGSEDQAAPSSGAGLTLYRLATRIQDLEKEYEQLARMAQQAQNGGDGAAWTGAARKEEELRQLRTVARAPKADQLYEKLQAASILWGSEGNLPQSARRAGHAAAKANERDRRDAINQFLKLYPAEWLRFTELWACFLPEHVTAIVERAKLKDAAAKAETAPPIAEEKPKRTRTRKAATTTEAAA